METILLGREIIKVYKSKNIGAYETRALNGININIKKTDFISIMGRSGSGKSTLLRILSTIDRPTHGSVKLYGNEITELKGSEIAKIRRETIGYVFQDFKLLPSLSISENIILPSLINKTDESIAKERVAEIAKQFNIDELLNKYPYEISGGEEQRVAICRALVNNPEIIFADEPTGNLDSESSKQVIETLKWMNEVLGKTIIIVTHDPLIAKYCKKVLFIKDGVIYNSIEKDDYTDNSYFEEILKNVGEF